MTAIMTPKQIAKALARKKPKKGFYIFTAVLIVAVIAFSYFSLSSIIANNSEPTPFNPNVFAHRSSMNIDYIEEVAYADEDSYCVAHEVGADENEYRFTRLSKERLAKLQLEINNNGFAVITGSSRKYEQDIIDFFVSEGNIESRDEMIELFGTYYLNTHYSSSFEGAALILGLILFMCLIPAYIPILAHNLGYGYLKSCKLLEKSGSLHLAEAIVTGETPIDIYSNCIFNEEFLFSGNRNIILRYQDILWLYGEVRNGASVMIIYTIDGHKWTVSTTMQFYLDMTLDQKIILETKKNNPDVILGYSKDNKKLYKERMERYKYNK